MTHPLNPPCPKCQAPGRRFTHYAAVGYEHSAYKCRACSHRWQLEDGRCANEGAPYQEWEHAEIRKHYARRGPSWLHNHSLGHRSPQIITLMAHKIGVHMDKSAKAKASKSRGADTEDGGELMDERIKRMCAEFRAARGIRV